MRLRLIGFALLASLVPATAWSQPPEVAELEVPVGQIEAYCDDFRQAMDGCLGQRGVALMAGQPLTDQAIRARRQCYGQVQTEFDLYTAAYCPRAETGMVASDYVAMCVHLNQRTLPCLRELGYQAVVDQPIRPEDYAYLRHCREQAGADMARARFCGPPAYSRAP
jgi:hypothetical protein